MAETVFESRDGLQKPGSETTALLFTCNTFPWPFIASLTGSSTDAQAPRVSKSLEMRLDSTGMPDIISTVSFARNIRCSKRVAQEPEGCSPSASWPTGLKVTIKGEEGNSVKTDVLIALQRSTKQKQYHGVHVLCADGQFRPWDHPFPACEL